MVGRLVGAALAATLCACSSAPPPARSKPDVAAAPPREVATWRASYRLSGDRLVATATITNTTTTDWNNARLVLLAPTLSCIPEDIDGFEDEDGCRERDNDNDGIRDHDDKCPNEPETYNATDDDDGCPDRGFVVTQGGVEILDVLRFAKGDATLARDRTPLIDSIATAVKANPDIAKFDVRGHATPDELRASPRLGLWRAATVRAALLERGVEPARVGLVDVGAREPFPDTVAVENNRRVSFLVIERVDREHVWEWSRWRPPAPPRERAATVEIRLMLPAVITVPARSTRTAPLFESWCQRRRSSSCGPTRRRTTPCGCSRSRTRPL